jgi:hypothetical protein
MLLEPMFSFVTFCLMSLLCHQGRGPCTLLDVDPVQATCFARRYRQEDAAFLTTYHYFCISCYGTRHHERVIYVVASPQIWYMKVVVETT